MNTDNPTIQFEPRSAPLANRRTNRSIVLAGAAALLVVAASATVIGNVGGASRRLEPQPTRVVERQAITEELVERGAIPWQSLLTTPRHDPLIQDLVDRGAIPRQSLLPASPGDDPYIVDLVEQGVIPREALLPAAPRPGI